MKSKTAQDQANSQMARLLLDTGLLNITLRRLAWQIIENHGDFEQSALIGMQPRGIHLAKKLHRKLEELTKKKIPFGYLDATFYRDDFRRRDQPATPNQTDVPFLLEDKRVVLIDDVLYTGRTIRAALDAMIAYGRPKSVELLVLIERRYSRELPIDPFYIGRQVNSLSNQRVKVEYTEQGYEKDQVWLVNQTEASKA